MYVISEESFEKLKNMCDARLYIFLNYIFMKKGIHAILIASIFISQVANATVIGSGTVSGSGALTSSINWNGTFTTGSASGSINGIVIKGRILPTLNMTISGSGIIDLGNMSSTSASSGSVNIEIGTNALNGASVTASSTNGGMANTATGAIKINSLTTDGFADSYKFVSAIGGASDSSAPGFTQTASFNAEVNNTTPVTLYTSNKPQNLTNVDDFVFTVSAQPNAQTPAGDYQDTVVVTVTGNF
jgi:hypothetical protein